MQQVILAVMTGAGGVGKTTLAANLGYEVARKGYKTVIFDLDAQGSISVLCRLSLNPKAKETAAWVYSEFFDGKYPLLQSWENHTKNLEVIRGGSPLSTTSRTISKLDGYQVLRDALAEYPLTHNLIILDCPAALEEISISALMAATHILIPMVPDVKAVHGTRVLLDWYQTNIRELKIQPVPKILGLAINNLDTASAEHVRLAKELPAGYEKRGFTVFPPVRHYKAFTNAWSEGVPLRVHRTTHPALSQLDVITQSIINEIEGQNGKKV